VTIKVPILHTSTNITFKVILRRAVHVDEEVLGHIFNIVVLNVIILRIIVVIIRNIVRNMWEIHLITIKIKLLTILMRKSLVLIILGLIVRPLIHFWHLIVEIWIGEVRNHILMDFRAIVLLARLVITCLDEFSLA